MKVGLTCFAGVEAGLYAWPRLQRDAFVFAWHAQMGVSDADDLFFVSLSDVMAVSPYISGATEYYASSVQPYVETAMTKVQPYVDTAMTNVSPYLPKTAKVA